MLTCVGYLFLAQVNIVCYSSDCNSTNWKAIMGKRKEIDIRAVVREHIGRVYGTQKAAADAWEVAPSFVSAVLSGNKVMPDYMANEAGYMLVQAEAEWVRLPK